MAVEVGDVQSTMSGDVLGWGFNIKDSTARPIRFITITYRTQTEANDACAKIRAATANAIDACIAP
jgi:hypothetical protein